MSKYIDAERLNMEWQTLKPFGVTDTMIENLKWIVDRQPTIEVSEDCISREDLLKHAYKREGVLSVSVDSIKLAPSVVPTTEQSCDTCRHNKREWDSKECDSCTKANSNYEPTTEQSSMVDIVRCEECRWQDDCSQFVKTWCYDGERIEE